MPKQICIAWKAAVKVLDYIKQVICGRNIHFKNMDM